MSEESSTQEANAGIQEPENAAKDGLLNEQPPNGVQTEWPPKGFEDNPNVNRYKNIDDAAKALDEKEKYIRNSFRIPGEDAGEEEWNKVFERFRPDKPEDYSVSLVAPGPDGKDVPFDLPEQQLNTYQNLAHKWGISQNQFSGFMQDLLNSELEMAESSKVEGKDELKKEWGPKYAQNAALVDKIYKGLDEETKQALNKMTVYEQSKFLLQIAKTGLEDEIPHDEGKGTSAESLNGIQNKIAEKNKQLATASPMEKIAIRKELNELYIQKQMVGQRKGQRK